MTGTVTPKCSYLNGLSLGNLSEDAVETAVVTDRQIAEVVVSIADDGHGSIRNVRPLTEVRKMNRFFYQAYFWRRVRIELPGQLSFPGQRSANEPEPVL